MAKQSTSTAVPRLRFPEFRGTKGWEEIKIGSIATILKGKGIAKSDVVADGAWPCIRYGELYTRYGEVIDTVYSRTNAPLSDLFISHGNDVIIPASGETKLDIAKASCVIHDGVALGGDLNVLRTDHNGVFLSYFLNGSKRFEIAKVAQGDTVVHLYPSQLQEIFVAAPEPAEQQKIADCLTSLDEVIAAQGRIVAALKAHKRGLMQQLFPREGETRPRLRFPEFNNASEWKEATIGSTMPFVTSGSRGWAEYYANAGSLFVRITNLSRGSIYLDLADKKFVNLPPEATEGVRTSLRVHDVLISITADIGIIGYVHSSVPSPAYINQHIALVRFDGSKVLGRFVAYYLAAEVAQRRFRAATDNGTKAGMNLTAVQNTMLMLPEFVEQQRIAECLSSLDTQITADTNQLAALKIHKQGLMQQLFPAPDAASA